MSLHPETIMNMWMDSCKAKIMRIRPVVLVVQEEKKPGVAIQTYTTTPAMRHGRNATMLGPRAREGGQACRRIRHPTRSKKTSPCRVSRCVLRHAWPLSLPGGLFIATTAASVVLLRISPLSHTCGRTDSGATTAFPRPSLDLLDPRALLPQLPRALLQRPHAV